MKLGLRGIHVQACLSHPTKPPEFSRIATDVKFGKDVQIHGFANLYGYEVGDNSKIGAFAKIRPGVKIGKNVKLSRLTFICTGVTIEDSAFAGHDVLFISAKCPLAVREGRPSIQTSQEVIPTRVKRSVAIGTTATIPCGITIGENAFVGAGSVVTKDVPPNTIVAGVLARIIRRRADRRSRPGQRLRVSRSSAPAICGQR